MRQALAHDNLPRRITQLVAGLAVCGTALALMVLSGLGLGPWDVLHQGISARTGLAMGTVIIVVGAAVLVLWVPLRERPGLGTVLNAMTIGVIVNGWLAVLEPPSSLVVRILFLIAGTPLLAAGVGLYIGAGLGAGPRDGLTTGLARRGAPLWLARSGVEVAALVGGWLLGGTIGIGTIVFVTTIGPLVHLSVHRFQLDRPAPEAETPDAAPVLLGPIGE